MEETINQRIARIRKELALPQSYIAERVGLALSSYSQKERKGTIDVDFVLKFSEITGVDVNTIIFGGNTDHLYPYGVPFTFSEMELQMVDLYRMASKKQKERMYSMAVDIVYTKEKKEKSED